jgi:hypothetical protein
MDPSELVKLIERKQALDTVLDGFEKWLIFFGLLVVIGVGGESLYGFRTFWNNRKLHEVQRSIDQRLASVQSRQRQQLRALSPR